MTSNEKRYDNGAGVMVRKLGAMPPVKRKHAEAGYTYQKLFDDYRKLPMQPLLVTAHLLQRFIPGVERTIHLDSLLAWAVVEDFPVHQIHDDPNATHVIPLPVRLLWVCPKGRPLWAISDLRVNGRSISGTQYWHKREPSDRTEWTNKPNVNTQAGRWKEARIPMPTQTLADDATLSAMMIGNRDLVARLLNDHVSHVGKKTSVGLGRVAKWSVDAIPHLTEMQATQAILDHRNVPLDYLVETGTMPTLDAEYQRRLKPNRSWTPPHWHAPLWASVMGPTEET